MRVVAVFGGGITQVKFGVIVVLEKFLHAVCMVVMGMAQNACVNLRDVDAQDGSILGELCGGSCVEQNAFAVEFGVDAKAPFAFQLLC